MNKETFQLPFANIPAAVAHVSQLTGFEPLNDIEKIDVNAKKYEFHFASISYYDSMV